MTQELQHENERLRRAVTELTILNEISSAVSATMSVEELSDLIVRKCVKHLAAEQGAIWLFDPSDQQVSARTFLRVMDTELLNVPLKVGASLAGWVLKNNQPLLVGDFARDERFRSIAGQYSEIRNLLAIPLSLKNRIIGLLTLFNKRGDEGFNADDTRLMSIIASQSAQSIENARLYDEEKRLHELEEDLKVARRIQETLLPKQPPQLEGYDLAGFSIPAREVGGDYFDFIDISGGRLGLAIADVSGKGTPAALLMAGLQACLRGQAALGKDVAGTVERVNLMLTRSIDTGRFVTSVYGQLDPPGRVFTYVNAGHNYPLLVSREGKVKLLDTSDLLLGVFPETSYTEKRVELAAGDLLVLYTDGITEAENVDGEFFGLDRLSRLMADNRNLSASGILTTLLESVQKFQSGMNQSDDITILIVKLL